MFIGIANSIGQRWGGGVFDPDAQAFLSAAGITGSTEAAAVNTLVTDLKSSNIWTKMKALYPFVTDNRNLFSYTEDFGNAYWSKGGITLTTNTTTAPDGTNTADTLIENTSTSTHYIDKSGGAFTATSGLNTMSLYVKKIVRDWFCLSLFDGTNSYNAWFNIANGTIGTKTSGTTASISNAGNGWYRISITGNLSSTGNFLAFFGANADNSLNYTGNGLASYYLWGAQLEIGSTATTYQPIATTQQSYISSQFKYNLKDPRDLDAAFRLVFNGGWTHSSTGATPNGTNGYADTKLVPSSVLTQDSTHLTYYSRTDISALQQEIGAQIANPDRLSFEIRYNGNLSSDQYNYVTGRVSVVNSNSTGFYIASRTNASTHKVFKNNSQIGATNTDYSGTLSLITNSIYIGSVNGATLYSSKQTAFASIGDGLNDTEASNLYTAVQAFQTSLNRAIAP